MRYIVIRRWNGGSDEETFASEINARQRAVHNRLCGFVSWVEAR